jgi:hypothetical protein
VMIMKIGKIFVFLIILVVILISITACAGQPGTTQPGTTQPGTTQPPLPSVVGPQTPPVTLANPGTSTTGGPTVSSGTPTPPPLTVAATPTVNQGPAGPQGPTGLQGAAGPQGPIGPNAQIVVSSEYPYATVVYISPVWVLGSNFTPGDYVHLTMCQYNHIVKENILVNDCGAFVVKVDLPPQAMITLDVVALKAWVDDGDGVFDEADVLWACWPLVVQ